MNKQNPVVILLLVLTLLLGIAAFSIHSQKQKEIKLRRDKEAELQVRIAELTQLQTDLADLQKAKAEAEKKWGEKIAAMEEELVRYEQASQELSAKLEALEEEKRALQQDKANKDKTISELTRKITRLELDKSDLMGEMKKEDAPMTAREKMAAADAAILASSAPVKLGEIVVQKSSGKFAKVQHVDWSYGFIVVDAGSNDGIKMDAPVSVVRDGRIIGKAVVQKLRPTIAAAVILPEHTQMEILIGDQISLNA